MHVLTDIHNGDVEPSALLLPITVTSAAATVSNAMRDLCQAAAIRPGVTVEGIRAWRARRLFDYSKSIEELARFLGARSLDVACEIVGYDWRASA